jgi:hypothetical protein
MNIYRPGVERRADEQNKYMTLLTGDQSRLHTAEENCCGYAIDLATWIPLSVIRDYSIKDNMTKPLGDRVGIDADVDPMVLSRRALDVLLPHIRNLGQVLPLAFNEAEYSFFNVTNVVDALDEEACQIWRLPSSGRIGKIERYVFKPEAVRDQLLFKIPQRRTGFSFVTDRFVELAKEGGLTGFNFKRLWTDEVGAEATAA